MTPRADTWRAVVAVAVSGLTTTLAAVATVAVLGGATCHRATEPWAAAGGGGGRRVLLIGNSLTAENDLPGTLAAIAALAGDTIRAASVTRPNFALVDHLSGGSDAAAAIARGGWEVVVLQQGPSSLPVNRDSLVLLARLFDARIRAAGARPALLMVWPERARAASFDAVRGAYEQAAREVDGVLVPAGDAWRAAWRERADLPLYGPDGYHPSELGTFLAGLVLYERITGRDARELPPRAVAGGHQLGVPDETVRLLQRAAHEVSAQLPAGAAR